MLLERLYEVTVDVRNPINFCADTGRHLMAALRNTYEGKCFKGAFIARVAAIVQHSACRIQSTNSTGEGCIDVQFLADVVVFSRWDILVGVRVSHITQAVIGTYAAPGAAAPAQAVVNVHAAPATATVAVGQLLAVRVVRALHTPMQPMAVVVGALLVADQAAPAYLLRGSLDPGARADLEPLLRAVEAELAARAALVAARRADLWFFELLLYTYRPAPPGEAPPDQAVAAWPGGPVWEGPGGAEPVAGARNVLEVVREAVGGAAVPVGGVWSRPLALYRSSPLAAVGPPPAGAPPPTELAPSAAFALFLKNILDFLTAVREMAELYCTRELVDSHRNIWTVMGAAQRARPG